MSASYFDSPLLFRIRKVVRYVRLYGISRTYVKVRGQMHARATEGFETSTWVNPHCSDPRNPDRRVAIVGCGNFAFSAIAYYLRKTNKNFLKTTLDTDPAKARSLCEAYSGFVATTDLRVILDDPAINLIYISSNHASHADYAIKCIDAGKNVHIEKPHVVSSEQLEALCAARRRNPNVRVFLGFNRPLSPHFIFIKSALDKESGPTMINWFIAGHEIPDDHWYFDEREGGRVLGNLCHWTDLTLQLVGVDNAFPCEVVPATHANAKSDYCVGLRFADRSIAGITFSAKGHTFEGVKEVLQIHRGNLLGSIRDFRESLTEVIARKKRLRSLYRDHGHGRNIASSWENSQPGHGGNGVETEYLRATANMFLAVRHAIDNNATVRITENGEKYEMADQS